MKGSLDQYQQDISEIVSMQNLLSNLNESNLNATIETIKTSKFIQSQDNLKVLLGILGRIIKYRKKYLQCFFTVIDAIFPIITKNLSKREIMFHFSQKLIYLKLLHDKYLTVEDIISFYGTKNVRLIYFYPEIKDILSDNEEFNQTKEEASIYKDIIDYFTKKEGEKIDFNDDPRLHIGNNDKLSVLIQKDDIESFQQMISQQNIDIKSYQIELTSFENKKLINTDKLYLIEYAAFHNSMNIFKFLLMNNSKISKELFQCAIHSGNSEIIHLSEKELGLPENSSIVENLKSILEFTVISHHNELYDYLYENFDHQTDFSLLAESIYYQNYEFFFGHFHELENKYNEELSDKNASTKKFKEAFNELISFCSGNYCPFLLKMIFNIFQNIDLNEPLYFDFNVKPDDEGDKMTNPFSYSIQMFNNKNAKFLLSFDSVDPDYLMADKITPFIWACFVGNLEMVEFLCNSKKVNILHKVDKSNENALHVATRMGNLDVVKFLVSLNVFNLEEKTAQDETVIETAARLGYKEIFDFLKSQYIKNGLKIDDNLVVNKEKYFPSHYKNPLLMKINFFYNLKEPISVCLLI